MSLRYPKRPNTRDWVMGVYPMSEKRKLTNLDELVEELQEFHHDEAAQLATNLIAEARQAGWDAAQAQPWWKRLLKR